MRTPNSCDRWLTENAMTPARPAAVMSSAMPANTPMSVAVRRGADERRRTHLVERPELIDRLLRIDRVHGAAHLLDERCRIAGRPRQEHDRQQRRLRQRTIERLRRLRRQRAPHVADDADDPQPGSPVVGRDPRAHGIGLREELPGHRIADDRDRLAVGDVAVVEESSSQQRNADGLKIARATPTALRHAAAAPPRSRAAPRRERRRESRRRRSSETSRRRRPSGRPAGSCSRSVSSVKNCARSAGVGVLA